MPLLYTESIDLAQSHAKLKAQAIKLASKYSFGVSYMLKAELLGV